VQSLRQGFIILHALAASLRDSAPAQDITSKLKEQLALEAKKFLVYRAYKVRDRQLLSLQRMRALQEMLREAAVRNA
jgi:hypothetical protein